ELCFFLRACGQCCGRCDRDAACKHVSEELAARIVVPASHPIAQRAVHACSPLSRGPGCHARGTATAESATVDALPASPVRLKDCVPKENGIIPAWRAGIRFVARRLLTLDCACRSACDVAVPDLAIRRSAHRC